MGRSVVTTRWAIELDSAGVRKGVKGLEAEVSAMRKAFDSLQKIKAFDAQLSALNNLASKLEAAKAKAAALAPAAQAGGKAAQNAYAKAASEVTRLEQSLRTQTSAVAASAAALDKAGISTKNLAAEEARVSKEYRAAAAAAGQAAKVQEAWAATGVRSTKEVEREIAKLQQLSRSGLLDQRGITAAQARIQSLNRELGRTPPAAQQSRAALASLTEGATRLAAAYLSVRSAQQAITVTAKFSDEMQAVAALTGASAAEMARLHQTTFDLAGAAGGPTAVAGAMSALATAGLNVREILYSVEAVRNMSAASRGLMSYAQAGDNLTDILKLAGLGIEKAGFVTDRLIKSSISASQTLPEFIESLKGILGYFTELYKNKGPEVALEKAAAAASALANIGTKGSKGGRILKNALVQLIAPSAKAADIMSKLSDEEQAETQSALGVIAAHKDMIRIFDDQGNFRDFPDILDDIKNASLTAEEKMRLFGRIAGPAMFTWTNQGGQAIRDMEAKIHSADNTAKKVSETMQAGLGGSIRQAGADVEKATITFTEQFTPALQGILSLAGYADNAVQGLSGTIKTVAAVTTASYGVIMQLPRAFEAITDTLGITDAKTTVWADNSRAAFAAAAGLGREASTSFKAAAGSVDELAEAQKRLDNVSAKVSSRFGEISQATGVTVNSMEELDAAVAAGKIRWDDATSSWVGAEKQKQEAVAKTALEAQAAAERAAEAEAEARKVAEKSWEDYKSKVISISDEIVGKTKSLDEQLKEMARSGMSAAEAQAAIKKEAEAAYAAAVKLAEAGNYEGAKEAAESAKASWADVAGNVRQATEAVDRTKESLAEATEKLGDLKKKAGKDGIISESEQESIDAAKEKISELKAQLEENTASLKEQKAALEESMAGVKAAGELEIEILQKQKEEYQSLADQLDEAFDFSSAGEQIDKFIDEKLGGVSTATTDAAGSVKTSMDASATSVAAASERITASINAIPSSKEITITERYVQERAGGGLVQGFASGGSPAFRRLASPHITAGSGLRDDVPAMLMRNEYVLRASAVAAPALKGDGIALATAHNHGNWERMQAILAKHLGPPQIKLDMPALRQPQMQQLGVIKLHVGDVQAEVYATPDNAAAIHAAIAEAQRRAQRTAQAKKRAGVK